MNDYMLPTCKISRYVTLFCTDDQSKAKIYNWIKVPEDVCDHRSIGKSNIWRIGRYYKSLLALFLIWRKANNYEIFYRDGSGGGAVPPFKIASVVYVIFTL